MLIYGLLYVHIVIVIIIIIAIIIIDIVSVIVVRFDKFNSAVYGVLNKNGGNYIGEYIENSVYNRHIGGIAVVCRKLINDLSGYICPINAVERDEYAKQKLVRQVSVFASGYAVQIVCGFVDPYKLPDSEREDQK